MLGRNHAALGVASFAGTAWLGAHWGLHPLTEPQALLGVAVAAGAALGPDLDEKHSLSGQVNPLARLPIFGGHRRRTHCFIAVGVMLVASILCAPWHMATGILVGLAATSGGAVVSRRLNNLGWLGCIPFGVGCGYIAYRWVPGGWWLVAAVAVPYASHLLGDGMTPGGLPLLLPFSQHKSSLKLFKTGSAVERILVTPVVHILEGVALYYAFALTTVNYVHMTIATISATHHL